MSNPGIIELYGNILGLKQAIQAVAARLVIHSGRGNDEIKDLVDTALGLLELEKIRVGNEYPNAIKARAEHTIDDIFTTLRWTPDQ